MRQASRGEVVSDQAGQFVWGEATKVSAVLVNRVVVDTLQISDRRWSSGAIDLFWITLYKRRVDTRPSTRRAREASLKARIDRLARGADW